MNMFELMGQPDGQGPLKKALQAFLLSGNEVVRQPRRELEIRRRDGKKITAELSIAALRTRGGFVFNGFVRDLTDKIAAEERIRQAEKMEAMGQLTGGIARDAMPDGGKLIIETGFVILDDNYAKMHSDVRPGRYAMIAVSDTGAGIPAAMLDKVFNPFFTSKGPGKGTGLGLSMVYGFIKQSAGHIRIYSEEGHGTTIRMYLPPGSEGAVAPLSGAAPSIEGGDETIVVVEDDRL